VRVVFCGTPDTAVPSLAALKSAGHDIALVVSQPDRPAGRSGRPKPPPVASFASANGMQVVQPAKVRDAAFLGVIRGARPDVLAVVAFGRILTQAVLDAAPHGAINLHFSKLPELRGAAPVQWALARGMRRTGVTTFRIDAGLDAGPLLMQRDVEILKGEHAPALLERLAHEGADLLAETLSGLESGTVRPVPQDSAYATQAPILAREDGWWSPSWTAADVEGRVRGFDPWPGVWLRRGERRLRLVEASVSGARTQEAPGSVLGLEPDGVHIASAGGTVASVGCVQPEGGKPISARDAWNGRHLGAGDRLAALESQT
jgi:methionyl-tRNA formyltransferase